MQLYEIFIDHFTLFGNLFVTPKYILRDVPEVHVANEKKIAEEFDQSFSRNGFSNFLFRKCVRVFKQFSFK